MGTYKGFKSKEAYLAYTNRANYKGSLQVSFNELENLRYLLFCECFNENTLIESVMKRYKQKKKIANEIARIKQETSVKKALLAKIEKLQENLANYSNIASTN